MLNLFSYGDSDGEEENNEKQVEKNVETLKEKSKGTTEKTNNKSIFTELPKVKKTKGKKQINLAEIAKFAQVPIEELRKEFRGENDEPEEKKVKREVKESASLFSMLPKPANSISNKETVEERKPQVEKEIEHKTEIQEEEVTASSSCGIQLNPFLDDATAIQEEEKENVTFTTIYHVPQRKRDLEEVTPSLPEESVTEQPVPAYGYGYGSSYSQSQYEAYMRRSGMLATASAKTAASANMLGEDAKYYDKYTKQALESGNVIELNQNDLHDHSAQPGTEYWERKKRKAAVAAQFGKYAHIAPTQVQQTRNQITYLASQAIEQLADIDSRRAQIRKTRKEVRSKYGW